MSEESKFAGLLRRHTKAEKAPSSPEPMGKTLGRPNGRSPGLWEVLRPSVAPLAETPSLLGLPISITSLAPVAQAASRTLPFSRAASRWLVSHP
jgi:hypothetical protein